MLSSISPQRCFRLTAVPFDFSAFYTDCWLWKAALKFSCGASAEPWLGFAGKIYRFTVANGSFGGRGACWWTCFVVAPWASLLAVVVAPERSGRGRWQETRQQKISLLSYLMCLFPPLVNKKKLQPFCLAVNISSADPQGVELFL